MEKKEQLLVISPQNELKFCGTYKNSYNTKMLFFPFHPFYGMIDPLTSNTLTFHFVMLLSLKIYLLFRFIFIRCPMCPIY